jgi:hypothetical protein
MPMTTPVRIACAAALAFLFLSLPCAGRAQGGGDPPSRVLVEGEELIYNVRYGFIDLGQVKIKITNGVRNAYYAGVQGKAYIDSYKKVPFVDLHAVFESVIDTAVFSRYFVARLRDKEHWNTARYSFEYDRNRVLIEVGDMDTVVTRRDTLAIDRHFEDGLSLFFYARDQLYAGREIIVPTLIQEAKVTTSINFTRERTSVEVDAVDYPIDVIGFEGRADFVGIFGLTGGFEGWFSNDEARVPIMAKMKVLIGSVTIELMKWTRAGWTPPRGKG